MTSTSATQGAEPTRRLQSSVAIFESLQNELSIPISSALKSTRKKMANERRSPITGQTCLVRKEYVSDALLQKDYFDTRRHSAKCIQSLKPFFKKKRPN